SNTDPEIIGWICTCLRAFNFTFVVEHIHHEDRKPIDVVRLKGGLREHLRFFHTVCPAISRKLDIEGQAVKSDARLNVIGIEPLKTMRLYDITTGTGDYISNGVVSHNCFARPSHAYLGLSPGIDFETRLFYKADAAKLLEAELANPDYVCKPITLGANTDPYQPVERRMKVTRSILEVLSRTRHPVTVITNSALVLRDLDLLAELARAGVRWAGYVLLRLPYEIKDLFTEWLAEHYPGRAAHVMSLICAMRGGREYDPRFGHRMRGTGPYALLLGNRFRIACRRLNLN